MMRKNKINQEKGRDANHSSSGKRFSFSLDLFITYFFALGIVFIIIFFMQESIRRNFQITEFYLNVLGIAFIIFFFIYGIFIKRLKNILHNKYRLLYRDLIWLDMGNYGIPILNYPQWIKFVWTQNKGEINKKLVYVVHAIEILILVIILFFLVVAWILTSK